MKAKLSILTLGVADLARAKQIYLDLGFPVMTGSEDYPGIAFFQLEGLAFALYPQEKLAEDLWGDQAPTGGATAALPRHTMARNEASEAEVDTTIAEAVAAGAKLIKPATKASTVPSSPWRWISTRPPALRTQPSRPKSWAKR